MLFTAARARGGVLKKAQHLEWLRASPRGADGTAPWHPWLLPGAIFK